MRKERELAENVWYYINTMLNNREMLFLLKRNRWLFRWTVSEAMGFYAFEIRGLRFDGAKVSFYIKPANGLELPDIMKWIKETFAVRFNLLDGRTGHIWGDRYASKILVGEPPEWAEVYVFMATALPVKRGNWRRAAAARGFRWKAGNVDAAGRTPDAGNANAARPAPCAEGRPLSVPDAEKVRIPVGLPRRSGSQPA
jgi:hypothetical protein